MSFDWSPGVKSAPAFRLILEEEDITQRIERRLMSLTLTDNRGFEADQLDIELDDADGQLELPRRGVSLWLALGWKGEPWLYSKGNYIVDEIDYAGSPNRLTLRARSADFRESLNTRNEKSWHDTTVGDIVKEIAGKHKLEMALGEDVAKMAIEHLDQTNESDASFLMRLAQQCGAIACVKSCYLLFIRQGQSKTASGEPLPATVLRLKDVASYSFSLSDREAYTGVRARWLNTREPEKKQSAQVSRKSDGTKKQTKEEKEGSYLAGTEKNVLVLNRTWASQSQAERAAKIYWERLQRGAASFKLKLPRGRADLYTEMPVKMVGFKPQIDDTGWIITKLTHRLASEGFTTDLEFEVKINPFEME